ncbi:hypothetical protein M2419_000889 [Sphingobacterium sp. BIGb0116]|nr:hypothetical protein [Sphingobacterium sp. BIGb0116]
MHIADRMGEEPVRYCVVFMVRYIKTGTNRALYPKHDHNQVLVTLVHIS